LCALFRESFTASAGAGEGRSVAALVDGLIADDPATRRLYVAARDGVPQAAIVFSRMRFGDDPCEAWLLSPVYVAPDAQGQGVGTALIRHGLEALRVAGGHMAVTYGDPAFYARVGFVPVSVDHVPPPHRLSQPQGWQARALEGPAPWPLPGASRCAAAFDDPALW
jgi:predicted N-acetyltransferase YhbS